MMHTKAAEDEQPSSDSEEEPLEFAVELDAEDEEAIERALESVRAGKSIPLDEFLERLQRA